MVDAVSSNAAMFEAYGKLVARAEQSLQDPSASAAAAVSPALAPEATQVQAAYSALGIANSIPQKVVGALLDVRA